MHGGKMTQYLTYEDYPVEDLMLYGGIDCLVTSELMSRLMPEISKKDTYVEYGVLPSGKTYKRNILVDSILNSYNNYSKESLEFIIDLELNGFKFDIELNEIIKKRMEEELEQLEAVLFKEIGREINLNSSQIVRDFLYVEKGFEVEDKTKTGEPSTDGDAIIKMAKKYSEHTWLPILAKRNDIRSLYNTFVSTYVKDFVKPDGRIHPTYNLHGTGSFRISGEEPNLTQLANPKHGYNLRTQYTVETGYCFLAADYSSAEVKILGALCKDTKLLLAIAEGKDFHAYSASEMYGIPYEEFVAVLADENHPLYKKYKKYRQGSKALTLNLLRL